MKNSKIQKLVEKHEKMRSEGINLIVSENFLSPGVRKALSSDLGSRYHSDWYGGIKYSQKIIEKTEELAKELFQVKYAMVTPISGNICDLAVLFAFTNPGDKIAMLPFTVGGYPLGISKFDRKRVDIPVDEKTLNIDIEATIQIIKKEQVKLTILGSSFIPFPHPVQDIVQKLKKLPFESYCVYDGSHVMGLIGCGEFQNPLKEGAEVLIGSTHKTFYGPQGGLVLTNSKKHAKVLNSYVDLDLESGIGLIDNPHINHIAALGIAMEEMLNDKEYGKRVIKNAKTLAGALDELGVPVKFKERGYTQSHQVLLNIDMETSQKLCQQLEKIGIFIDIGGRIGTAEVTHRGMDSKDMLKIAELIANVYHQHPMDNLKKSIKALVNTQKK
jgi:glycine hydroxymethyltransferase